MTRLLVLMVLTLAAGIGLTGPAAAHNVLIGSDPTDGSTLQTAPTTVKLTFDQPVQNFEPVVAVLGPDGQHHESGGPVVDSTVVTASVDELPGAGAYVIAWRVVSADGHPVQGEIHFELASGAATVAGPGSGSGAVSTGPAAAGSVGDQGTAVAGNRPSSTTAAGPATSSGLNGWAWAAIVLAGVLVAAAIFVTIRPRQPR